MTVNWLKLAKEYKIWDNCYLQDWKGEDKKKIKVKKDREYAKKYYVKIWNVVNALLKFAEG